MANQPVQLSPEWWMAYGPSGDAYYHNTTTNETTWSAPPGITTPQSAKALDQQAMASYFAANPGAGAQGQGAAPQQMPQQTAQPTPQQMPQQTQHMPQSPLDSYVQSMPGSMPTASPVANPVIQSQANAEISVHGSGHIPAPWTSFSQVQFAQPLISPMLQAGFQTPSPIQQYAWPIAATGRDLIGVAKTGSGKTLGFLLPAFSKALTERLRGAPLMLVMAPTRELACQIDADAKKFASPAGIQTALAYGGAPKGPQLADLRRGPHLLTGTPGRLNDFLEGRMINLSTVRFLVLDEADRMLDMGFEPQIRKVISNVPPQRQTMMFTATWPKEVRNMARDFFRDPLEIRIGNVDELVANADITQQVVLCRDIRDKERRLVECLRGAEGQVIIFTKTKKMCDQLSKSLERMGVKCEAIHGDRDQTQRDMALNSFKSGAARILVATDVAARGLDVKAITMVLNFDPAGNAEDYVHRIGRTGRAGRKGTAVTLLTPDEGKSADQIMKVMQKTNQTVSEELQRLAATAAPPRERRRGRSGSGGRDGGGGRGGGDRGRSRSRRRRSRSRSRSRSGGRRDDRGSGGGYGGGGAPPGGCGGGGAGHMGMQPGMPGMMPAMHGMGGGMPPMGGMPSMAHMMAGGMPGMAGMGGMPGAGYPGGGMPPGMGGMPGGGMPGMCGMPGGCMPGMY